MEFYISNHQIIQRLSTMVVVLRIYTNSASFGALGALGSFWSLWWPLVAFGEAVH